MTDYAELHCVTNFSFLRGASHPEELVAQARHLGLSALAITDRNSLAGVVRAHIAAKDLDFKTIVGAELVLAQGARTPRKKTRHPGAETAEAERPAPETISLLAWPTDRAAYGRLCRLLSLGQRRAEKGQCILSFADVHEYAEGSIFALAAEDASCESTLRIWRKSLKAPLYLAVARRHAADDRGRIARLAEIARKTRTPLLATNHVLYHHPGRRPLQDVVTAIREKVAVAEAGFLLEANAERHLKPPGEMARLFREYPEAVANTIDIADACRFSLDELKYEYPDEPVPKGTTPQRHLDYLTWEGAKARYPGGVPAKIETTIARELVLIEKLDYAPYFLTVHDIVQYARSLPEPILCQGRGSAANSAVCYCLGITAVDPSRIDLLFERFISEERKEPPDIDVDFEHERREEVIQYIYARYGRERAGLTATVISYRGRSAVREVGKAMGLSEDVTAALAGIVWGRMSDEMSADRLKEAGLDAADPLLARVLDLCDELSGFPRHLSQHVGGFVLTRGRLDETVPIGNAAMEDRTVIEWDKDDIDTLGILKVDVLGLGMLTCIRKSFELIEAWHGLKYSLATVPPEDPAVYDMLCKADSVGVFQVESRAQMNMLPRLKPRCFYDLVIEVAIVRPGPIQGDMVHPYLRRRDGIEPEEYPSPDPAHGQPDELRQVLGRTKGVPLFQEQAMKLAMVAAEFTPGEMNELRKAMATFRRRGTIGRLETKMVTRMVERGYDAEFAQRCFNQIRGFGEYGFPESHAASFAHLVYVSSWLKCHYPAVFACALLNSQPMGFYAPAQIVRDAREHGVEVLPPDAMASEWDSVLEACDGVAAPQGPHPPSGHPLPCAPELGEAGARSCMGEGSSFDRRTTSTPLPCKTVPIPLPAPARMGEGARRAGEGLGKPALRLGLREVDGLKEEDAKSLETLRNNLPSPRGEGQGWGAGRELSLEARRIDGRTSIGLSARGPPPTPSPRGGGGLSAIARLHHDGLPVAALEKLAAADAFRSLRLDRRQALWEVKALAGAKPLPLFAVADEQGRDPPVALPEMPLPEHVVADYRTIKLSLKAHPMSFLRGLCARARVVDNLKLRILKNGAAATVAGVVLIRQRPGTAKGVVFLTLEDEFGVCNAVVWPRVLETHRAIVMGARLMLIRGCIQRVEDIVHVVAGRIEDKTAWLSLLTEEGALMRNPLARADEVVRPGHDRRDPTARHPRQMRIIPKSRDFH